MKKYIFIIIFIVFTVFSSINFSFAQTANEIKKQISDTNAQIAQLDKEIKALYGQITVTNQQKDTLANAIKDLTLKRNALIKERQQTEKKISATGLVIKTLDTQIEEKTNIVNKSKKAIASLLKELNQIDGESFIQRVLIENSFSDFSDDYNNMITINDELTDNINYLLGEKVELSKTKDIKQVEQNQLNTLKKTLTAKEIEILSNKKEKDALLIATKNKETAYQKLLAERQKQRDAFESSLSKYEDQLKFILNPKSLPNPKHGILSWPLDYVLITQMFGITSSSGRLYRSGSHSGVDFRATIGTKVMSMGEGTIVGTGDTDVYCKGASFGKWVFIKYDNGLSSTYGHLSSIIANTGDRVKAGTVVALSGNTGHSTGPHLHITVYASDGASVKSVPSLSCNGKNFIMPIAASSSYLDPLIYLPSTTKDMYK